ncbi:hypothetical protein ES703_105117 [subsurface metagenome]
MNRVRRIVEKEGLILVVLGKLNKVFAVKIRQKSLRSILLLVDIAFSLHCRRHARHLVESAIERALLLRTDIPFPDLARNITCVAHELGHSGVVIGDGQTACHAVLSEPLGIHAGHQAASTRAARGIGDIGVRTFDAVGRQRIHMRRGNVRTAEGPQFAVCQVIYKKNNNVGPGGSVCKCRNHRCRCSDGQAFHKISSALTFHILPSFFESLPDISHLHG